MTTISVSAAKKDLTNLVNKVSSPICIKGEKQTAVLISEKKLTKLQKELSGMKETLYLKSIPGLWESIEEASKTPLSECIPWREVFKE